jgi:hypothetical protein
MQRTSILVKIAGLAALGLAAYFLMKPPAALDDRIVLGNAGGRAAAFIEDATLRNVLGKDITYTIRPGPGRRGPLRRELPPGGVDRIATDQPVEIEFDSGPRTGTHTVRPGRPYSFRYDAEGVIKVYPGAHGRADAADLAPFVPTPLPVVERMLEMAAVARGDVVYDIGCGDGRMVIAAAKKYGARGVGIDIDGALVEEARSRAREEGVAGLVRFVRMDGTKAHIREATVLALYLLPESLEDLKPLFERELRPGARIVSHNYRIPGWDGRIAGHEVMAGETGREHKIFLYVMPAGR